MVDGWNAGNKSVYINRVLSGRNVARLRCKQSYRLGNRKMSADTFAEDVIYFSSMFNYGVNNFSDFPALRRDDRNWTPTDTFTEGGCTFPFRFFFRRSLSGSVLPETVT